MSNHTIVIYTAIPTSVEQKTESAVRLRIQRVPNVYKSRRLLSWQNAHK